MKKAVCVILALMMLMGSSAVAETVVNAGETRNITIHPAGLNEVDDGISPVTGLDLNELAENVPDGFVGQAVTGWYMPVLIQIDNSEGGVGNRAPWDGHYADVVYETPLYKRGVTRMSFLFSDIIPEYVGPCRSARVNHVWIREEWDCPFCHWGGQKYPKTNIEEAFRTLGARKKGKDANGEGNGILYDGTSGGKPWNAYCGHTPVLRNPNDAYFMPAGLVTQIVPKNFAPANHTYKFTDEIPEGGDDAETIYVTWGDPEYSSMLEYDDEENVYFRYMVSDPQNPVLYDDIAPVPNKGNKIVHREQEGAITFSNVIVQFMKIQYRSLDAPDPTVLGTGNCEIFQGGRHFKGVWNRETYQDRTVFYGEDGEEVEMQRGHTLIIMMDYETEGRKIRYE